MPLEVKRRRVEHGGPERRVASHEGGGQRVGTDEDVRAGSHVRDDRHGEVIGEREHPEDPVVRA